MISVENVKKRNSVENESIPSKKLWMVRKKVRSVTQNRHAFSMLRLKE
jgi:hypothetical protein